MHKKLFFFLFVLTLLAFFHPNKASAATGFDSQVQLTPIEDTFVKGETPTINFGSSVNLETSDYSTNNRSTYLKFDLSSLVGKTILGAQLRLTPTLARTVSKTVHIVNDSTWNEMSMTFNTAPPKGEALGGIQGVSVAVGQQIDILLDPAQFEPFLGKNISLAIDNFGDSNTLQVSSRDATSGQPVLLLTVYGDIAVPSCPGDVNRDNVVDLSDYSILVNNFLKVPLLDPRADLNGDSRVDLADYSLLVNNFLHTCSSASPTPVVVIPSATIAPVSLTPTRTPTKTPTMTPSRTPTPIVNLSVSPTLPPTSNSGIWISTAEIMALPMSGSAWDKVLKAANGSCDNTSGWGTADLSSNTASHDVCTLAGALVAVRMNDSAMRNKVIAGLQSAMVSPLSRSLELSRGMQSYVIAADIINYHDPAFESWVRSMINNTSIASHSGGPDLCNRYGTPTCTNNEGGILCTAKRSTNNWGGHARASMAAAALYLHDTALLNTIVNAHKAFIGLPVANNLYCSSTNWHPDPSNKVGVNPAGSVIQGRDVSGVLPEDWRRGGEFSWPPPYSDYQWEGMQGYVTTAVILHRAGLVPFNSANDAVVRSMTQLYSGANQPAIGDDTWIPWVINHYSSTKFPTTSANQGKGIAWTDWTFPN